MKDRAYQELKEILDRMDVELGKRGTALKINRTGGSFSLLIRDNKEVKYQTQVESMQYIEGELGVNFTHLFQTLDKVDPISKFDYENVKLYISR